MRRLADHCPLSVIGLLVLCAVFAALSWPPVHRLWTTSITYSHGYLVLALVVWLAIREVRRLPSGPGSPDVLGLLALAVVTGAAVAAHASDVLVVQLLLMPAVFVTMVWSAAGWTASKRFVAPAAYLIFAIPVWDHINEPLRVMTTSVVEQLAYLTSIPTFVEGNTVHIPSGTFHIEGGCSGLHYLIVACALSALYGLLELQTWKRRAGVVAAAAALALIANWIRVYVIILAGHLTDMQHYLVTVDHYYFGWGVFFVVLAPLLILGYAFDWSDAGIGPAPAPASRRVGRGIRFVRAAAAAVVAAAIVLSTSITLRPNAVTSDNLLALRAEIGAWTLRGRWNDARLPRFIGTFAQAGGWYERGDELVGLYRAHYPVQRQGFEVVFYANRPAGANSRVAARSSISVAAPAFGELDVTELEAVDGDSNRRLIWYGYRVAGRSTSGALAAKLYQAIGAVGRRWDADVWVISSGCSADGCSAARGRIQEFFREAFPTLRVDPVVTSEATPANDVSAMERA